MMAGAAYGGVPRFGVVLHPARQRVAGLGKNQPASRIVEYLLEQRWQSHRHAGWTALDTAWVVNLNSSPLGVNSSTDARQQPQQQKGEVKNAAAPAPSPVSEPIVVVGTATSAAVLPLLQALSSDRVLSHVVDQLLPFTHHANEWPYSGTQRPPQQQLLPLRVFGWPRDATESAVCQLRASHAAAANGQSSS